jgi:hypothetical protein
VEFFQVRNWPKFQHYSKRNPPWIKLYTSLLDDFEFLALSESSRLLAMNILMLAAKTDNKMPKSPEWLKVRFALAGADLQPLYDYGLIGNHDASKAMLEQGDRAEQKERKKEGLKPLHPEAEKARARYLAGVPR